eukprot:2609802-Amphidinium_carterae.1
MLHGYPTLQMRHTTSASNCCELMQLEQDTLFPKALSKFKGVWPAGNTSLRQQSTKFIARACAISLRESVYAFDA